MIETPHSTWEPLRNYVSTKDLGFEVSSGFKGTASSRIDNKIEIDRIKYQLQELAILMKKKTELAQPTIQMSLETSKITDDFANFFRKSGQTIAYCSANRAFQEQKRQQPQQRDKFRDLSKP